MFDSGGNFSQIIIGSESRMFGAKTYCAFGSYSVDEADENLVTCSSTVARSPRSSAQLQERKIVLLTADELKYINPLHRLRHRSPKCCGSAV